MSIVISIAISVVIALLSIWVWSKYDALKLSDFNTNKKIKIFLIVYVLGTIGAFAYAGFQNYSIIVLCKLALVYLLVSQIALIDYRFHIIPNKILLGVAIARLCIAIAEYICMKEQFMSIMLGSLIGAAVGFGVLMLTNVLSKGGIGMGDVKLFGVMGFVLGLSGTYNALFYALIILVIYSAVMMGRKKITKKSQMPFGPFVFIGYLITFSMGAF